MDKGDYYGPHQVNLGSKNIYHAIFESDLRYRCQIWYQSNTHINDKIAKLQKKASFLLQISVSHLPPSPPFKEWIILKINDIVEMQTCLLVHSFLNAKLPESFESFFQKSSDIHIKPTRFSSSMNVYTYLALKVSLMVWNL